MEDEEPRRYQQHPYHLDDAEKEAVGKLKIEIKEIKNLKCPINDEFLIRFLRTKKNDVEKTLHMIERFLKAGKEYQKILDLPYSSCKSIYDTNSMMVLKNRDEKGRQIFYCNISLIDVEQHTFDEIKLAIYLLIEEMSYNDESMKNGCCFIVNYEGLTFNQAKRLASFCTIKEIKMFVRMTQNYPVMIKGIYVISVHFLLAPFIKLIKLLVKDKLRKRIWTSWGNDILKNDFSPNILPVSLGGNVPDEEAADTGLQHWASKNCHTLKDFRKYVT